MTAKELLAFKNTLDLSPEAFADITGLSAHRLRRGRIGKEVVLPAARVAVIARCQRALTLALEMCRERELALDWLYAQSPALDGRSPLDQANTAEGLARLEALVTGLRKAVQRNQVVLPPAPIALPDPEPNRKFRIAERMQEARARLPGLTKAEIARQMQERGFPKFQSSTASRFEIGYADAPWREIEALAAIMKVAPNWLAGRATNSQA